SSRAARWIPGVALHCYFGDPSAMTALHKQFPNVRTFETECSGVQSSDPANTFSDTLKWHSRNLEIGSTRNWSQSVVNWNLDLDVHNENDNPQSCSGRENGQSFDYTLPGAPLATFEWSNPPQPAPPLRALDPSGSRATANPPGPSNPCCTGDVAANAVDDDAA